MKILAYRTHELQKHFKLEYAEMLYNSSVIDKNHWKTIQKNEQNNIYHPGLIISILLFIATLLAWGGIAGIFGIGFDSLNSGFSVFMLLSAIFSFAAQEFILKGSRQYFQAGINEALLLQGTGYFLFFIADLFDPEFYHLALFAFLILSFCSIRYLNTICLIGGIASLVVFVVGLLDEAGGSFTAFIPFVIMGIFSSSLYLSGQIGSKDELWPWQRVNKWLKGLSLLLIYLAGNYFIVRTMSESLMGIRVAPNEDIPLAFFFYGLTLIIPLVYLFFSINNRDTLLLRIALISIAFSVFTFKYYFSLGHPEITLTLAGMIMLGISYWITIRLKTPWNGITMEKLFVHAWGEAEPESLVISQTMGGNEGSKPQRSKFEGGDFGGAGAGGEF